jgi:hypothetical protein
VKATRVSSFLIAAAAVAAMLWAYGSHAPARRAPPEAVPVQDGRTIDFSNGSPVVANGAADKAALDAGVKAIDEATRTVTFDAEPAAKK